MDNYIPFANRYIKYKIMNYGKPYNNYISYKLSTNLENIEIIYIDNEPCAKTINPNNTNLQNTSDEFYYYVEIHYSTSTNKPKLETIMKNSEINDLLKKYGCKL